MDNKKTPLPEGYVWHRVMLYLPNRTRTNKYHIIAPDVRTLCGEPVNRRPAMRKGFQDLHEKPLPFDCHECHRLGLSL